MLARKYVLRKVLPSLLIILLIICLKNLVNLQTNESESKFGPLEPLLDEPHFRVNNHIHEQEVNRNSLEKEESKLQEHLQTVDSRHSSNRVTQDPERLTVESKGAKLLAVKDSMKKTVNNSSLSTRICKNHKCNFVFIKTMKCATETVVRILRKYSYDNDLNIMLPRRKRLYFAWPYLMDDSDYRLSDRPFNGLIDHAIYNKTIMNHHFPPETTHYVTIIREPLKHLKSTFNYFKVALVAGIYAKNRLAEYLHNIEYYDSVYKTHEAATFRYCIPDGFSVTKNLIGHCLGMPLGFPEGRPDISNNLQMIKDYTSNLDADFSLVMIVEYFHESLVLFKRLMNWDMKNIIYKHVNRGAYSYLLNDSEKSIHRRWASIDYMIYDHFNKTLWKKIAKEGPDFLREVQQFSFIQKEVNSYCWGFDKSKKTDLRIEKSEFNSVISISQADCKLMDVSWFQEIKDKFDKDNHHVIDNRPELKRKTC